VLAHLALAAERPESAWQELEHAEALDRTWGLEMRALFATLPFVPRTQGELREVHHALERWDIGTIEPSMFLIFAMHNDLHPAIRAYLLGLLEVRLGNLAGAAARVAELGAAQPEPTGLARSLEVELRATVARAEGRAGEGLMLLERCRPELWFQLTVASPFFSLASQRFLRAELLHEVGRREEAAAWYGSIAERSPYELIYAPAARRQLAEISEAAARR
jgi:hypothetical protein